MFERNDDWPSFARLDCSVFATWPTTLAETRPDVVEVLRGRVAALCTQERAARLVALAEHDDEGKRQAAAMIAALGAPIGPALLTDAAHAGRPRSGSRDLRARDAARAGARARGRGRVPPRRNG